MKANLLAIFGLALFACKSHEARPQAQSETPPAAGSDDRDAASPADEEAHAVIFSDRAIATYLLLVRKNEATLPTRAELVALVRRELSDGVEVEKLVELIEREPIPAQGGSPDELAPDPSQLSIRKLELLGLHLDLLPLAGDDGAGLIDPNVLTADVLTRALLPEERDSLPSRTHAILLRADYRNRDAVRGLRLLQTLVRLVAAQRAALIHDPETQETVGVVAFSDRRLRSELGNVADQIVVVPFSDPRHGPGFVRLSTRGMRRFGSVDLELDGLPEDPAILQRGTDLLQGLAYRMVREGEIDLGTGLAVRVPDEIEIGLDDVRQSYASRGVKIPACTDCPQAVDVHLVERTSEPHDPPGHVVARVIAPRSESDAKSYDHPQWAKAAIAQLFGP